MISVQGLKCAMVKTGEGPPLVLLHGWAQSSRSWKSVIPDLARHFTVYALDLPGFGASDAPPSPWSISKYAKFVHEYMCAANVKKPAIIGHSFGARIAMEYASRFPTRKLVVCATAGDENTRFRVLNIFLVRVLRHIAPTILLRAHTSLLTPRGFSDFSRIDAVRARRMLDVYTHTHRESETVYSNITCPALLLYGERDRIAPVAIGKALARKFKNSELVTIPRTKHFPFIDAPQKFADIVTDFLAP